MTVKTTRWSPDTCGCVVDYSWDSETVLIDRIHTYSDMIKTCPVHISLSGPDAYVACESENQRKNYALARAQEIDSRIEAEHYEWSFDDQRVLEVRFNGINLSGRTENDIQSAWDIQFGPGLVRLL